MNGKIQNHQSFVGAMKIARNLPAFEWSDEWHSPFPAPSLRELARPKGVTEGVSSDGSSKPTVYQPIHINSETFERLRSSKYTPSVSHSLDSSLREGAGNGCAIHCAARKPQRYGRFSSPLRRAGAIQRAARKPQRCGRFSSPLRKLGWCSLSPCGWGCIYFAGCKKR